MFETTEYFKFMKQRPDRATIKDEWIEQAINNPIHQEIQSDNRIRRWAKIEDNENRYLRIVLLEDAETVHNAFFDRRFKEQDHEN